MKQCKKCGLEISGRDCKPCKAEYMRQWNAKNPDKIKTNKKKTYEKHKTTDNQRSKNWAEKNRTRSNQIKQAYKERNREKYLAQQREYAKKKYLENREKILEKEKLPERKEVLKVWREENRERLNKEYIESYHFSEDLKTKQLARCKVRRAILSGKLIKATECSKCGSSQRIQAHHHDYSKPLEVIFLCTPCHQKEHSKYFKQVSETT